MKDAFLGGIVALVGFAIVGFFAQTISAQTSCLLYPSNASAPSGYGASWDALSGEKEFLVKSDCPTSGNSIGITVGKGDVSQFIWSKMYVYNNVATPPAWEIHTLAGTVDANGWVTNGSGTKTITTPFTATPSNPLYFVGYVCTFHSSQWKCGCANSVCTDKYWQLQGYEGVGGGGSTDGSTGGTGSTAPAVDGIGVALPIGGPGNHEYFDSVSKTIILEKVDSPLTKVQWNNRYDHAGGRSGYHSGNGGEISVRVRKVNSIGGGRMSLGPILGETDHVLNPINPASWTVHWQREGGSGSASGKFSEYPTLRFKKPIDLEEHGLRIGDPLAFEFVQHNRSAGSVSINVPHADALAEGSLRAFSKAMAGYRIFRSSGAERAEKVALLLIGYQDGTVIGNPWFFCASCSAGETFDVVGSNRIRQVIPISQSGNSAKSLRMMATRPSTSTASPAVMELREAGSNPGGSSDEGTLLCSGSVAPSGATQIPSGSSMKHDKFTYKDQQITCPSPVPLVAGKTYYVVVRSDSTPYRLTRMHRATGQPDVGLRYPSFMTKNFKGQQNTGSGWRDMAGGVGIPPVNDAPLWISF